MLTDLQAEIGVLIVAQSDRGAGIGRRLMQYAQQWADEQGYRSVLVRSNIVRQEAHKFYEKIGYSNIKTSLVFHKILSTTLESYSLFCFNADFHCLFRLGNLAICLSSFRRL